MKNSAITPRHCAIPTRTCLRASGSWLPRSPHGPPRSKLHAVPGPHGKPLVRAVALPARDWDIEDTWHAAGLKGTGSHHIALREALVPEAHVFDLDAAPRLSGPLYQALRQWLPLLHGAFSVGLAEGAVDDLLALAHTGRQQLYWAVPMRESDTFQFGLG